MYSESVNIYVDSDEPAEVLASQIEQAFGIRLWVNADHKRDLIYADSQQWLVIHEQERFVDRDESAADFPYWIEVGSYAAGYTDRLKYAHEFARLIYEKLKAARRYRFLMLADPEATLEQVEALYGRAV